MFIDVKDLPDQITPYIIPNQIRLINVPQTFYIHVINHHVDHDPSLIFASKCFCRNSEKAIFIDNPLVVSWSRFTETPTYCHGSICNIYTATRFIAHVY